MIEKGQINLGLIVSVVVGVLVAWLVISLVQNVGRRSAATPAPPAPAPAKKANKLGFETGTAPADDAEPPAADDE